MTNREVKSLRVGLVGCGRWGRNILRDLVALECHVSVADVDACSREEASNRGAASVHADAGELPEIEGVVVATPATLHAASIAALIERGVPVFVEKPFTTDAAAARSIVERAGDRVFVMDKWRYHAGVACLAQLAQSGDLGPLEGIKTVRVGPTRLHDDADCLWTLAPHDLAIAHEVMGEMPAPDRAVGDSDEVRARLTTNAGTWHELEVSTRAPAKRRRIEVHCASGTAVLDGEEDDVVQVPRSSGASSTLSASGEPLLLAELREFVVHLAGGPPPRASAADGARAVEVIEQLHSLAGIS